MFDFISWLKLVMATLGAGLIAAGHAVEPSEAVWIMAVAGGLLGVALGEDRSVKTILVHVCIGVIAGIAMANLVETVSHLPRAPLACLCGLFAARMTVAINREIDLNGPGALMPNWFRKRT